LNQIDRAALSRVIAVINGKGGVFKTTLTANIGGLLAQSGYRVLLVDLDPQGNLAEDLGYTSKEQNDDGKALAAAIAFDGPVTPVESGRENLDVLPGGPYLDSAAASLASRTQKDPDGAQLALARVLAPIAGDYDMIIIDCPPGNEPLQSAAVAAARYALIPVKTDLSSLKGMTAVAKRLDGVVKLNPTLDLLGVVLVGTAKSASKVQRVAREHVTELFGVDTVLFPMTVRHAESTAQVTRQKGLLAHEVEKQVNSAPKWFEVLKGQADASEAGPRSAANVAGDLHAVTQEVIARIVAIENEKEEQNV
jgi:cellulose biosynthesis protein BcsQ